MKERLIRLIHSRHMLSGIFLISVLEATILPIALEILLLPLMQARREKIWQIAILATLGCMLGALFGYFAGAWLMDNLAPYLLSTQNSEAQFNDIKERITANGFWFILMVGVTPVPIQLAMLAAGATNYSLALYLLAIAISRALRYFCLALMVLYFGDRAEQLILRYKKPALIVFAIVFLLFVGYQLVG